LNKGFMNEEKLESLLEKLTDNLGASTRLLETILADTKVRVDTLEKRLAQIVASLMELKPFSMEMGTIIQSVESLLIDKQIFSEEELKVKVKETIRAYRDSQAVEEKKQEFQKQTEQTEE